MTQHALASARPLLESLDMTLFCRQRPCHEPVALVATCGAIIQDSSHSHNPSSKLNGVQVFSTTVHSNVVSLRRPSPFSSIIPNSSFSLGCVLLGPFSSLSLHISLSLFLLSDGFVVSSLFLGASGHLDTQCAGDKAVSYCVCLFRTAFEGRG